MAKCNLGKVKVGSMRSAVVSRHGLGATVELSAGGCTMVWIAFACLLACEIGHFACLIFNPPPPSFCPFSALCLVSIESGKYSTDWVQCDGAVDGGRSHDCHGYLLPRA